MSLLSPSSAMARSNSNTSTTSTTSTSSTSTGAHSDASSTTASSVASSSSHSSRISAIPVKKAPQTLAGPSRRKRAQSAISSTTATPATSTSTRQSQSHTSKTATNEEPLKPLAASSIGRASTSTSTYNNSFTSSKATPLNQYTGSTSASSSRSRPTTRHSIDVANPRANIVRSNTTNSVHPHTSTAAYDAVRGYSELIPSSSVRAVIQRPLLGHRQYSDTLAEQSGELEDTRVAVHTRQHNTHMIASRSASSDHFDPQSANARQQPFIGRDDETTTATGMMQSPTMTTNEDYASSNTPIAARHILSPSHDSYAAYETTQHLPLLASPQSISSPASSMSVSPRAHQMTGNTASTSPPPMITGLASSYQPFPEFDRTNHDANKITAVHDTTATNERPHNLSRGASTRNMSRASRDDSPTDVQGGGRRHSVDIYGYTQQQSTQHTTTSLAEQSLAALSSADSRYRKASLGTQQHLHSPPSKRSYNQLLGFASSTTDVSQASASGTSSNTFLHSSVPPQQQQHRWIDALHSPPSTSSSNTTNNNNMSAVKAASSSPSALPSTIPSSGNTRSPTRSRYDSLAPPLQPGMLHNPIGHGYSHGHHGHTHSISHTQGLTAHHSQSSSMGTSPPSLGHASRYDISDRQSSRNNELEAKIVLLGRQGVGKTCLVQRYITGKYFETMPVTIGASFLTKKLIMDGVKVRLQIWDTAGQERFRSMAPMYYRGAQAAIIMYDLTSPDSLDDVQVWLEELRKNMPPELIVHIVACKLDLAAEYRQVPLEDAKSKIAQWITLPSSDAPTHDTLELPEQRSFASSFGLSRTSSRGRATTTTPAAQPEVVWKDVSISEVSAKHDEGIEDLFLAIASKLVERKSEIEHERILRTKDSIMIRDAKDEQLRAEQAGVWGCC